MKKIICIISIISLVLGWLLVAKDVGGTYLDFENNVSLAEQSVEAGLYEQGVEYYNAALSIRNDKNIYQDIKETYWKFYQEQNNQYSYNRYIVSLEKCCDMFKNDGGLWEELIKQYYNSQKYNEANTAINKAINNNATTEKIISIQKDIRNLYEVNFLSINSYTEGKNNTYSVTDGNSYWVMQYNGDTIGINYNYVGPLNESGEAVFVDNSGSNIKDSSQITRILLKTKIEECGFYNSGVVPVRTNEKWIYINEDGEDAKIGEYDFATSMFDGKGAVEKNGNWAIINSNGKNEKGNNYTNIVLDKYGCFSDGEKFIASVEDKYMVYSFNEEKIAELNDVSDVNVGEMNEYFAFKDKNTNLWGYKDYSGKTVIKPSYSNAKGFSNGFAAVCNDDGLWGIIADDGSRITDFEFYYVGYFTSEINCMVSRTEGAMGIFSFNYR